jgi:hypothetical protein
MHSEPEMREDVDEGIEASDETGSGRVDAAGSETMTEVLRCSLALGGCFGGFWESGLGELPGCVSWYKSELSEDCVP